MVTIACLDAVLLVAKHGILACLRTSWNVATPLQILVFEAVSATFLGGVFEVAVA